MTAETYKLLFDTQVRGTEDVRGLQTAMIGVQNSGNAAAESLTKAGIAGGIAGAAFSRLFDYGEQLAKGLWNIVAGTAALAEAQQNTADRIGLTIKEVGLFSTLAENAGVNANAFTTSMRTLTKALSENSEEGKAAKEALRSYNVELTNAYGAALPMRETFIRLGEAFGKIEDPVKRADLAIKVLGRSGLELLPALKNNAAETLASLERLGVGFDESGAQKALAFDSALDQLGNRLDVVKRKLGELLASGLLTFINADGTLRAPTGAPAAGTSAVEDNLLSRSLGLFVPGQRDERLSGTSLYNRLQIGSFGTPNFDAVSRIGGQQAINFYRRNNADPLERLQAQLVDERKNLALAERSSDAAAYRASAERISFLNSEIDRVRELNQQYERVQRLFRDPGNRIAPGGIEEAEIDPYSGDVRGSGLFRLPLNRRPPRSLFFPGEGVGTFVVPGGGGSANGGLASRFNPDTGEFSLPYEGAGSEGAANDASRIAIREQARQRELAFRERLVDLMTRPGGELDTARQIYQLRVAGATTEAEIQQANYDLALRTVELLKQRENAIRGFGQQAFGALLGGRAGIGSFVRGQLTNIGSTIAGNAAVSLFGGASSPFSLTNDPNSTLGKLLAGTPFGADPMKDASVDLKSAAIDLKAAAALLSGGAVAGGGTAGLAAALGLPAGIFQGAGRNPLIFSNNGGGFSGTGGEDDELASILSARNGGPFLTRGGRSSLAGALFDSSARPRDRVLSGVATAAALYGGYEGITSGLREGGVRGGLGAASAGLATAAALDPEPVSKAILAAAAAITGIVRSVLPDPKTVRGRDMAAMLDAAAYSGPTATQFDLFAGSGSTFDYDFRGGRREQPIQVIVQTMDARSFMDNSGMVADAVRFAMQNGHSINQSAREAALGQ